MFFDFLTFLFRKFISIFLLFAGCVLFAWQIWIRFFRTRLPREIPDMFFTEYKFWILFYICVIYIYIIKMLIKPPVPNEIVIKIKNMFGLFISYIFLPLKTLDEAIKYNPISKSYYAAIIKTLLKNFSMLHNIKIPLIILNIVPRIFILLILIIDIFYFNLIKNFYFALIFGIFPLLLRYLKYSLEEIYERYINLLEAKYDEVYIMEEDFEWDISRKHQYGAAPLHFTHVSVREYVEIKYKNMFEHAFEEVSYRYIGIPFSKEEMYLEFKQEKYNHQEINLNSNENDVTKEEYFKIFPQLLKLKQYYLLMEQYENLYRIKSVKIIIFFMYLLCWLFCLGINSYYFPMELSVIKYISNYIVKMENPFI